MSRKLELLEILGTRAGLCNRAATLRFYSGHCGRIARRLNCPFPTDLLDFLCKPGVDNVAGVCHRDSHWTGKGFSLCSPLLRSRRAASHACPREPEPPGSQPLRPRLRVSPKARRCGAATRRVPGLRAHPHPGPGTGRRRGPENRAEPRTNAVKVVAGRGSRAGQRIAAEGFSERSKPRLPRLPRVAGRDSRSRRSPLPALWDLELPQVYTVFNFSLLKTPLRFCGPLGSRTPAHLLPSGPVCGARGGREACRPGAHRARVVLAPLRNPLPAKRPRPPHPPTERNQSWGGAGSPRPGTYPPVDPTTHAARNARGEDAPRLGPHSPPTPPEKNFL